MRILLLFILILPNMAFSQLLSSKTTLLDQENTTKSYDIESEGFNFALVSRFDGGIVSQELTKLGRSRLTFGAFNATALEFYIPALVRTPRTRFLIQLRFSAPLVEDTEFNNSSLYNFYFGFGMGFAQTLFDNRSPQGKGWQGLLNFIIVGEFNFSELYTSLNGNIYTYDPSSAFAKDFGVYRIELGVRWNYFLSKKFAFVLGASVGGGFGISELGIATGSDGYPLEPLHSYGMSVNGFFTFGMNVGLMF